MSVLEKNSIDYIYVEDNHIIMGISDHLTWQEETIVAHWQLLQDKLKNIITNYNAIWYGYMIRRKTN